MSNQDQLKEHSYDGIQEYDNNLPRWWLFTFYVTVIFGFIYWFYYETFEFGPTQTESYQANLSDHQTNFQNNAPQPVNNEALLALTKDQNELQSGQKVFQKNCVSCHGNSGEGLIGPNLTDQFWIHGNQPTQIYATIENGVLEKGMLSWKGVLSPTQIKQVTAYIVSLKGTNPPNAKTPEGTKY